MISYCSLVALYEANKDFLNIPLSTIKHFDFSQDFETDNYKIHADFAKTTKVRNEHKTLLINILV